MSFNFNTQEDVATQEGEGTLERKNGIARLVGPAKAKVEAKKVSK